MESLLRTRVDRFQVKDSLKLDLSAWEQSIEIPLTVSDCTTG